MSRTNLDFLFQAIAPATDRAGFGSSSRTDELLPPFGDHLNKAASTALPVPTEPVRNDRRPLGSDSTSANGNNDSSPRDNSQRETTASVGSASASAEDREKTKEAHAQPATSSNTKGSAAEETEASVEVDEDVESGEETSDDIVAGAAASAVESEVNKKAIANAASVSSQSVEIAIEGASQNDAQVASSGSESQRSATQLRAAKAASEDRSKSNGSGADHISAAAETIEQPVATKAPKKAASGKAADEGEANIASTEVSPENGQAVEPGSETSIQLETTATAEQSLEDAAVVNKPAASSDSDTTADKKHQDSNGSAGRQQADAIAIAAKAATTAVANTVSPQPRDDSTVARESTDKTAPIAKTAATKTDALTDAANRLHANPRAAKSVGQVDGESELPRIDPARFVGRVAKAFQTAQERGGSLQLRLSPPELGAMRLELSVKDGVMSAALETETNSARRVLLEHLPALRERLAEQNIRIERFDVDVRREGTEGHADPRAPQDRQSSQHGQPERRQPATQQREATAPRMNAPAANPLTTNSGINLVA